MCLAGYIALWLLAKLACRILYPEDPALARCMILSPQAGIDSDRVSHREIASSSRAPWEQSAGREASVPFGQLLVGYSYVVNLTLALARTYFPYNLLVTDHDFESKSVKQETISCVATPRRILGASTPSSSLLRSGRLAHATRLAPDCQGGA